MTTFPELEQKRQTKGLTSAEKKQWEALFNQDEYAFEQIFRTPVGGKVAIPNEANRRIIWQWAQGETEPITDTTVWFANIFRENPNLVHQLAWQDQRMLDPAYQAELTKKQLAADRQKFEQYGRDSGLYGISDANFDIVLSTLGPGLDGLTISVTQFPDGPAVLDKDGNEYQLQPPTGTELQQWANEKVQAHQERLRTLAVTNDIQGLRAAAEAEREETRKSIYQHRREYEILKLHRDRMEYELPPLPSVWLGKPLDATRIKFEGEPLIRTLGRKFGFSRLTAILHGLDESFFNDYAAKLRHLELELFGVRTITQGNI